MPRIAVTGYGAISSLGESVPEIWEAISRYEVGYKKLAFEDPKIGAKFFGFVEDSPDRYKRHPRRLTRMLPLFAKNALVAADEAITMAFGPDGNLDDWYSPFDRGAIIGTGWGGIDEANANNNEYRKKLLATSFSTLMSMNNVATAAASIRWNLRGCQTTPIAACATGTIAIGEACDLIRLGRAKFVLAGASESLKEQFNVWAINIIQALTKEQESIRLACCPFSAGRSGFVLSEGAAILCLEDFDSAVARGAKILGEITGYANYSDARDMTAPADDLQARICAIEHALRDAGRRPSEISYINTHGTSTPHNDSNETRSIKAALGQSSYGIPMSSTKSYTGHMIGAAGSMEAIICLKALETGQLPGTNHLDDPDPECDLNFLPNRHLIHPSPRVALNFSFGFGGANAVLVLERVH